MTTARTITVDGFTYTTTAPQRPETKNTPALTHYTALLEEARNAHRP